MNISIQVSHISKVYKLYRDPIDRLKESLHPLKKKYHKEFYALNDFSMTVGKAEIVGIIGKNGSGKSTLLKIVTGVLRPSGGSYQVNGKISALLELGAGFNPERTGLQNVYLTGAINGFEAKEMDNRVKEIIDFADIGEFINQPTKTYSSGMNARLAFAVAIHVDPDVLIVDEILSVGDAAFQRKCSAKIEAFKNEGKTIFLVSHSEDKIVQLCDRAIWINDGQKVVEGPPKLITGLYLKYSNRENLNINQIAGELEKLKEKKSRKSESKDKKTVETVKNIYNPKLTPASTIYYDENGAKISDIKIKTLEGAQVNVLHQRVEYKFSYTVEFDRECSDVIFGMLIKNRQGIALSGGGYSLKEQNSYRSIEKGEVVDVEWTFKCLLNEGYYFLNAGVRESLKGDYLHRITDALMIRVVKSGDSFLTGLCLLVEGCHVTRSDER